MSEVLEPSMRVFESPYVDDPDEPCAEPFQAVLRFPPGATMNDDQFLRFCEMNSDLQIERTAQGEVIIRSPGNLSTNAGNVKLLVLFARWADADGTGRVFSSSAGFRLRKKAMRSPDLSWVLNKRLARLDRKEWKRFARICPDFVVELRSPSDSLTKLKAKMDKYMENGARLGWLINPPRQNVFIYRPDRPVEELCDPAELSGEDVLPDFILPLPEIWKAMEL